VANKQGNTTVTLLNIHYYLTTELTAQGYGFVNVFESYPDTSKDDFVSQLPGISVGIFGDMEGENFELGNIQEDYSRPIVIDIFTKPRLDMQCNDLVDVIKKYFYKDRVLSFLDFNASTPYLVSSKIRIDRTRGTILATAPSVYNHGIVTFSTIHKE